MSPRCNYILPATTYPFAPVATSSGGGVYALPEVMEKVHQPKIHQQISNLPTARFLGLADVGVEVT